MKKNLLTILALLSFAVCSAQVENQSNYDVDSENLKAVFQRILYQLNSLKEQIAELENERCSCCCNAGDMYDPYNGHEYVDLGLPSGLKWASMNVGASSEEEVGDYFAWGETEPYYIAGFSGENPCGYWKTGKTGYYLTNYKWCSNAKWTGMTKYTFADGQTDGMWYDDGSFVGDNKTSLELADDAAHVNWGGGWRMPTKAELDELRENCTWEWEYLNRVYGCRVSSKINRNSIFLPAGGYRTDTRILRNNVNGYYWLSSLYKSHTANYISVDSSKGVGLENSTRVDGFNVRAVCP